MTLDFALQNPSGVRPFREKNQKELQFRRESIVKTGFSPDIGRNLLIEK
jgi:hypothetical protein